MPLTLATGPVTWGVDFADAPGNPPWTHVLDEIAMSGVRVLELGPVGYLPEDPDTLRAALDDRGLTAVGSFVFEDLHDPERRGAVMQVARRACDAIVAARGSVLVIIDRPSQERSATAARSAAAARLTGARWASLIHTIEEVATLARGYGLRAVVHPHAGTSIEFEDEIERLLDHTDLDLCLDTGHLAYAGLAPHTAIAAYGRRLGHVHLKDVRGSVLRRAADGELGFWEAVEAGAFCPIGEGVVDMAAVLDALEVHGYEGVATIEQDREPGSGTALDDLRRSLDVLERAARTLR
jgi:inosose dehydratase